MIRDLAHVGAALATGLALAAPALAFQAGDVYWAPGACDPAPPCFMFRVDAALGSTQPFVAIDPAPGQIAWEPDGSALYVSQFDTGSILRITPAGDVSTWATGIPGATGLVMTSGGTLLAVSYSEGEVHDVTLSGDYSTATPFASGFTTPRNLLERSNGDLLLVDQTARTVYKINGGSAVPFAHGFTIGIYDLVEDASGGLFLSARLGVWDVTNADADPDFSDDAAFATFPSPRFVVGLAVDPDGRLLATEIETGAVYDISAGGDFAGAVPVATVPNGLGDSAIDTADVAFAPQVPALGPLAGALLASLLLASGARRS